MLTSALARARRRERDYHVRYYRDHNLGDTGTWLARPAQYALDAVSHVRANRPNILDLGCGVGRHALPIVSKLALESKVVGVDIVPEALEIFQSNANRVGVANRISCEIADVAKYDYGVDQFDLVLSVSCIEHVSSLHALSRVLSKIQQSTRCGGVNCFMISTDIDWYDEKNDEHITPIIEFPLGSVELIPLLEQMYSSWMIADLSTKRWRVSDVVDGRAITSSSVCVQFTAIRPEEG